MKKYLKASLVLAVSVSVFLSGCANSPKIPQDNPVENTANSAISKQNQNETTGKPLSIEATATPKPVENIDLSKVKPNESGKIMVVMFHNFVESFTPSKYDDGAYTTTFSEFEKLLSDLYDRGYRLISLNDYLKNNINVPAGCIPMIFTFDDGTPGQFNLVEENSQLTANKKSAVGIMEEFNKKHPDFGLKGTFYVNLGLKVFDGGGTVDQRLKYLVDKGFEVGNHTLTHVHLNEVKTAEKIMEEVGGNQKKMLEYIPGYMFTSLALPFGQATKELQGHVVKGEYQGVKYENKALMEVGWDPTFSPVSKKFNPISTHRVRASGIKPVEADLAWWLKNLSRDSQYISDGNPDTVTVPKDKEADVDKSKLSGKELKLY